MVRPPWYLHTTVKPHASSAKWPIDRRYPRFTVDLRLVVKPVDGKAAALHGRTKNISESGMAATVAGDLALGEVVDLQFQLPATGAPLTLRADVRYRQGSQYGFNFIGLTTEQAKTIRRALATFPAESLDVP